MQKGKVFASWFKRDPLIHSLFIFVGIVLLLIVVLVASFPFKLFVLDRITEKIIDKKFHAEIAAIPQIKVTNFKLWEGDSIIGIDIEGKGPVSFWYGQDGVPRVMDIGRYYIPFVCFYVDNQGNRTDYAYDTSLVLPKDNQYKKWFPFEVNNLQELVDKYDSIIRVLSTFPNNPEMVNFQDKYWGERLVVKNPNPDFILRQRPNILNELISQITMPSLKDRTSINKDLACDLYVTIR